MGKYDLGINLTDRVFAFARKSILHTKPVTQFNTHGLRYAPKLEADSISITSPEVVYSKLKSKLKSLVTDKNGNFVYRDFDKTELVEIPKGQEHMYESYIIKPDGKMYYEKFVSKGDEVKFNIDKDFLPLNEDVGILIHGTSEKAYNKILKEGFKTSQGFVETFDGIYFTRLADGKNPYGEKQIYCLLDGKVVTGNIGKISDFIYCPTGIDDYLSAHNIPGVDAVKLKQLLLKDEFIVRGYKGLYANSDNNFAKCKSLVVFNPKDIKIIANEHLLDVTTK